jgi:UDP-N-acetylglucosamine--N-acetylmuramyl-(pentapeptide) pyrophosphoryl-undecaprenol N-acetylglucosamine transferase
VTGNPVRPAIAAGVAAATPPPPGGSIRLLVLGGSLGARVFSDVVPAAWPPARGCATAAR